MTVGVSGALAADWLSTLRGVPVSYPTVAVKLHTGDPGAAGTSNPSAETTRKTVAWAAPDGSGRMSLSGTPQWTPWTAGPETLTHVTFWDSTATSGGSFLGSGLLADPRAVSNTATVTLSVCDVSIAPIAA